MNNVDQVYALYESNKITKKETINQILTGLFTNKPYFNLQYLDEDQLSEFLLYFYKYLDRILLKYDKSLSAFSTFLRKNIDCTLRTWLKNETKKSYFASAITRYAMEETLVYSNENEPEYNDDIQDETTPQICFKTNKDEKKMSLQILILALKSVYRLTPEHLEKIETTTGIDHAKMENLITQVKKGMTNKIKTHEKMNALVNDAYIKRIKYLLQAHTVYENSPYYTIAKEKYLDFDQKWKKRVLLQRNSNSISPSNSLLAEILGMNPSQIAYIVKKAKIWSRKKNIESIS